MFTSPQKYEFFPIITFGIDSLMDVSKEIRKISVSFYHMLYF